MMAHLQGFTPLHMAVLSKRIDKLQTLLLHGAKVDAQDSDVRVTMA